jgi:squalene-hopene/tetraprenyl-beta-curcumene cyclase
MFARTLVLLTLFASPIFAQDWNARSTAQYLDSRQKEWFEWPTAKTPEGPCISCHTNKTYLFARPALRRQLAENQPTSYETGLLDALRARVQKKTPDQLAAKPTQALGVEAVFSALFLAQQDVGKKELDALTVRAFDQLWSLQLKNGKNKGAWPWFSLELDPWEMPESAYYGASIAAIAIGNTPAAFRNRPDVKEHVSALIEYLQRERESQPLHNQAAVLWASSKLPGILSEAARKAIILEILSKQGSDGGWTIESLGPWAPHPQAVPAKGSNSYGTAFVAFALQQGGIHRTNAQLSRALTWLRSNQDSASGTWKADSLNKQFPAGSMQSRFMQDAATAFAVLALTDQR